MSTAADRRAAYAWVASVIDSHLGDGPMPPHVPHGRAVPELARIRDAMRAASEVVDGEGVNTYSPSDVGDGTS